MTVKNEFKLTVESKSINESFCRVVVSSFASTLDPTIEELTDLKTAVSEAVTNSIVHGYDNTCGKIYITGQITDDSYIKIIIKDKMQTLWYQFKEGWLPDTSVTVYSNKLKAENAGKSMGL